MNEMELVTDVPVIDMELDVVTRNYPVIPNPEGTPTDDISSMEIDNVIYAVKDETARTELENKVDKEEGKGLSEEDFTHTLKTKLDSVETGANKTIVDSSISSVSTNPVQNKVISDLINDMLPEKTKTGNPILITDASGMSAKSLKVELEPIQDLHGYDNPWAGGTNKNKLPVTATSEEIDGITYTVASDGKVTANGTATANSNFYVMGSDFIKLPTGEYTLNGCPSGGGTDSYSIRFEINGEYGGRDAGSGKSFELTNTDELKIYIRIAHGTQVNNMVFAPMVRPSSIADGTFVPYANICPIEGRTDTTVSVNSEDTTVQFGQTVYAGEVDVTSGILKITHAITHITNVSLSNNQFYAPTPTDMIKMAGNYTVAEVRSNLFPTVAFYGLVTNNALGVTGYNDTYGRYPNQNWIYFGNGDPNITTQNQMKTWLQNNPLYVCYKLATPIEVPLTANEISLASGNNTITGDGDMEITYSIGVADSYSKAETDTLLNGKVDKVDGKGLSTNDYTTAEKTKLDGIEAQANKTVVDVMISPTSTNPVQNRAIYDLLNDLLPEATATGNPIAITNASGLNAKSLKVELEPIQDLNGYDSPWVGGGGKNKLPLTVDGIKALNTGWSWNGNVGTFKSVLTATLNTNSSGDITSIVFTGETDTTNDAFIYLTSNSSISDDKIMSGCPTGGAGNTYCLQAFYDGSTRFQDTGSGVAITTTGTYSLRIKIARNQGAISTLTFKPMLRLSSVADGTFAPYSNICPISGRTQTDIKRCGKNNLNIEIVGRQTGATYTKNSDGSMTIKAPQYVNIYPSWVMTGLLPQGTFVFSNYSEKAIYVQIGSTGDYSRQVASGNSVSFNYDGESFLRILSNQLAQNTESNYKMQIEVGSTATPYEPYIEADTTIQFGQTVYGGEIDVTRGVLTLTTGLYTFTGNEEWNEQVGYAQYYSKAYLLAGRAKVPENNTKSVPIKTSIGFFNTAYNYLHYQEYTMCIATDGRIGITADLKKNSGTLQGETLAYELATHIEVPLTPQIISLLKGNNTLTADGDMELIYSKIPQ